jgi:hypothetical protein
VADRNYRRIVDGPLSDRMTVAFEGMTRMTVAFEGMALTRSEGNTALTGHVRDQAEF